MSLDRFLLWFDQHARWIVLLALAMACALWLSSCARPQQQVIADTAAAAHAAPQVKDDAARMKLLEAIAASVAAIAADLPGLPAPTQDAATIAADPSRFLSDTAATVAKPPVYQPLSGAVPPPSALHRLLDLAGFWCVTVGGIVLGSCVIILALGFIFAAVEAVIAPFERVLVEAGVLGLLTLLLGAGCYWLGDHLWVLAVIGLAVSVVLAIRYRRLWLPVLRTLIHPHPKPVDRA